MLKRLWYWSGESEMFNCKSWKSNAYDLIFSSNLSKYVRGNAWNVIEGIDLEIEWLKKSKG